MPFSVKNLLRRFNTCQGPSTLLCKGGQLLLFAGSRAASAKTTSFSYPPKLAFNEKKTLFTSKWNLNLRGKPVKCYICSIDLYDCEPLTFGK